MHMVSPEDEEKVRVEQKQQRRKAGRPRKEEKATENYLEEASDSEKQEKEDKIENPESNQADADDIK